MEKKNNQLEDLKHGQRVALTATIVVVLLAVSKYLTGYFFDSRILVADAFHNGVDSLAIFASWFGLRLAARKKTARFPYGLYRAETFVTLVVGVFIIWAGIENLIEGYRKFFLPAPDQAFPVLPVIVSCVSVLASYTVAKMERKTGSSINSGALQANASEAFLDIGTSLVVLAGILMAYMKIRYIEGSIIMIIAFLIIRLGIKNVWTPILVLLDANLDPGLQADIERTVSSVSGVREAGYIKIRQSGPFKMVECSIATSPSVSVYKAHELANRIENIIEESHDQIESVFIHVEPARQDTISVIIPVEDMNGLDSKVYGHFGRAPYYIILKLDEKGFPEIEDFYYNEFLGDNDNIHVAVKVIKTIIKHNLDIVFTPKIGEIAFHMLKDHFIDIYRAETGATVNEIIERYRHGEAEAIKTPHPVDESLIKLRESIPHDH